MSSASLTVFCARFGYPTKILEERHSQLMVNELWKGSFIHWQDNDKHDDHESEEVEPPEPRAGSLKSGPECFLGLCKAMVDLLLACRLTFVHVVGLCFRKSISMAC